MRLFLHVVQIATDSVQIVAASTTNAPAGLSINDLVNIYRTGRGRPGAR